MPPRALVVTPNRVDAELALGFLAENAIPATAYESISELGGVLPADAGCIVLTEEALVDADMPGLRQLLEVQPAWSDLPLVLVAGAGAGLAALVERAFPNAGNVTLLERPLNPLTLVSAVQVGLRARARQRSKICASASNVRSIRSRCARRAKSSSSTVSAMSCGSLAIASNCVK